MMRHYSTRYTVRYLLLVVRTCSSIVYTILSALGYSYLERSAQTTDKVPKPPRRVDEWNKHNCEPRYVVAVLLLSIAALGLLPSLKRLLHNGIMMSRYFHPSSASVCEGVKGDRDPSIVIRL